MECVEPTRSMSDKEIAARQLFEIETDWKSSSDTGLNGTINECIYLRAFNLWLKDKIHNR